MFEGQEEIRYKEFPQLMNRVWLNSSAFVPHAKSVIAAMEKFMHHFHDPQIGGNVDDLFKETMEQAYAEGSKLLACSPENISIIINTAHGLNFPLHGIDWEKGDNIVTCQLEFPTNYMPWLYISKRKEVELREAKYDNKFHVSEDDIINLINDRTKLVSLSLVQFNNGQRINAAKIAKVAHDHGALISLDAIQAMGAVDVYPLKMDVDFVSAGGPKYLMAPLGIGLCYISSRVIETMDPPLQGTGNYNFTDKDWNDRAVSYHKGAKRFEYGTTPFYCLAGLGAALKIINSVGIEINAKHNFDLTERLYDGFNDMGLSVITPRKREERAALLNVRLDKKRDLNTLVKILEEKYKVTISARFGGLRFSTQLYNTEEDIDKALDVLKEVLN
ncbi:MAG: aminotransferase class V-fold PLP-dependent enzyme [Candidatus Heimdallarchaeota archaeon]|nr:aminotransferase class V-fold PLP-dependent enzyme [Candidatus Heimdallarchaeota archaeon]